MLMLPVTGTNYEYICLFTKEITVTVVTESPDNSWCCLSQVDLVNTKQCCDSGSVSFWATRIRHAIICTDPEQDPDLDLFITGIKGKNKKNLDFYCIVTFYDFLFKRIHKTGKYGTVCLNCSRVTRQNQ
jgi:hypothetical protein